MLCGKLKWIALLDTFNAGDTLLLHSLQSKPSFIEKAQRWWMYSSSSSNTDEKCKQLDQTLRQLVERWVESCGTMG